MTPYDPDQDATWGRRGKQLLPRQSEGVRGGGEVGDLAGGDLEGWQQNLLKGEVEEVVWVASTAFQGFVSFPLQSEGGRMIL